LIALNVAARALRRRRSKKPLPHLCGSGFFNACPDDACIALLHVARLRLAGTRVQPINQARGFTADACFQE
jgi:hypothetical protein